MGIFTSTPAEVAEKERRREEAAQLEKKQREEWEQRKREAAFNATPTGIARAAKAAGRKVLQIDAPLSQTRAGFFGPPGGSTPTQDNSNLIESIEAEGWRLENVGYVYRVTGGSMTKPLLGAVNEATNGEIIGIYLFRAT